MGERYGCLAGRIAAKKAAVASAHQILVIAFAILTRGETNDDAKAQPAHTFDVAQYYLRKLERVGYIVTVKPAA